MAWSNQMGNYSIACDVKENPMGTFNVTVIENGKDLHRQSFTGADPIALHEQVWNHVWKLQDEYRERMMEGLHREWDRQAAQRR